MRAKLNTIGCNDFSAICFDSCLNWCSNQRMTNKILLHVGMFWGLFVFTLNKHKDKNLATLATHIILKKYYTTWSQASKKVSDLLLAWRNVFFFTLIRGGLKDVPYPFFDHSSIVTRVTLHWRKGRLYDSLWLRNGVLGHTPWVHRVLSSQCSRAFSRFPWHKGDTIREVFSCFFSWNCFCHDDRGSAYRSRRTKEKKVF